MPSSRFVRAEPGSAALGGRLAWRAAEASRAAEAEHAAAGSEPSTPGLVHWGGGTPAEPSAPGSPRSPASFREADSDQLTPTEPADSEPEEVPPEEALPRSEARAATRYT